MTAKTDLPPIPEALADLAMVDGPSCAAAAAVSLSTWHEAVRVGDAPAPVLRAPRCTRWLLADVRRWLLARAVAGRADVVGGGAVVEQARRASAKAREPAAVEKARATRAARIAQRTRPAPAHAAGAGQ